MTSAATTETRTQYGIRKPNGDIVWATGGTSRYLDVDVEGAVTGGQTYDGRRGHNVTDGRAAMATAMRAKAKAVGIPEHDFVNGHEYVTRDIITITMEPVIVPALPVDLEGRF